MKTPSAEDYLNKGGVSKEELGDDYSFVINIMKEYAEYCLTELQKENGELRDTNKVMLQINNELRKQMKQFESVPNLVESKKRITELENENKRLKSRLNQEEINHEICISCSQYPSGHGYDLMFCEHCIKTDDYFGGYLNRITELEEGLKEIRETATGWDYSEEFWLFQKINSLLTKEQKEQKEQ